RVSNRLQRLSRFPNRSRRIWSAVPTTLSILRWNLCDLCESCHDLSVGAYLLFSSAEYFGSAHVRCLLDVCGLFTPWPARKADFWATKDWNYRCCNRALEPMAV